CLLARHDEARPHSPAFHRDSAGEAAPPPATRAREVRPSGKWAIVRSETRRQAPTWLPTRRAPLATAPTAGDSVAIGSLRTTHVPFPAELSMAIVPPSASTRVANQQGLSRRPARRRRRRRLEPSASGS